MATTTEIRGTIASVNDRGVKLEGSDAWINFSQYAKNLPAVERGSAVDVQVDARGFVRSIVVHEADTRNGHEPRESTSYHNDTRLLPSKDLQIIRESCLKSAAQFCASRPEAKTA